MRMRVVVMGIGAVGVFAVPVLVLGVRRRFYDALFGRPRAVTLLLFHSLVPT
jgi:hypothetical protein